MSLAEPYMREIDILTSMKGISVFIAAAIIADSPVAKPYTFCQPELEPMVQQAGRIQKAGAGENRA